MFLIEHMMAFENLDSISVGMAERSKAIGIQDHLEKSTVGSNPTPHTFLFVEL